jgi:iron complex outermembrane receptor protein
MKIKQNKALLSMLFLTPIGVLSLNAQESTANEDLPELEMFIAEESAAALNDSLLPTDRAISGLFGDTTSILQVPRSVTLLSPELLEQYNIDDLRDLEKFGAGTQQANYYGVAGTPQLRGVTAGTYLNGMLRAYNRNEMPLSFGSLEAIEIVKGPAPAEYETSLVGGFVNLIPKSPFYDETRGSAEVEVGSYDMLKMQFDVGGPIMIGDMPAAYRASVTSQQSDSYYDKVSNDYTSMYGAIKFQPKENIKVFTGGEYFDYKSNENAGWNRVTQDLIDNGTYVIGSPIDITSGAYGGNADRSLAGPNFNVPNTFGGTSDPDYTAYSAYGVDNFWALAVDKRIVDQAVTDGTITTAQRDLMLDLADAGDLSTAYGTSGATPVPQEKYRYTEDYINSGGEIFTEQIDGSTVIANDEDYANSTDYVWFGDVVIETSPDREFIWKNFAEYLETSKFSTYGYAIDTEQTILASKFIMRDRAIIKNSTISLGGGLRYAEAKQLQDYDSEPFQRTDLTQGTTPNDVIYTGAQRATGSATNLWSPGASRESESVSSSLFATLETHWTDDLFSYISLRGDHVNYDVDIPSEVEQASAAQIEAAQDGSGTTDYLNAAIGLNYELFKGVNIYGTYQEGTSVSPSQGGVITGEGNFNDSTLTEVGVKFSLLEDKLFTSLAYYEWEQSGFNDRSGSANNYEGEGFEAEVTWQVTEAFTVIGSYTWQEVMLLDGPGYRAANLSAEEIALSGGTFTPTTNNVSVSDYTVPGSPATVIKLFGIYKFQNGFGFSGGGIWSGSYDVNYERTLKADSSSIFSANVFYEGEKWDITFSVENLTGEDYYLGADPSFASNTVGTKGPNEPSYALSVKYKF